MTKKRAVVAFMLLSVFMLSLLTACSNTKINDNLQMSETAVSLTVGSSVSLDVFSDSGSAATPLTWTSSDDNIATVDAGTVKAKAPGSAVIKAADESGNSCACNVTVTDKEITSLSLDHQTATVEEGKTIQLTATFTPTDATSTNLTWSSSDNSKAVVNSEGYVTGVAEGVANISCKAQNGVEASCTVTVKASSSASSSKSDSDSNNSNNNNSNSDNSSNNNNNSNNTNNVPRQPSGGYYGHFAPSYEYDAADFVFPDSSVRELTRSEITSVLSSINGVPISGSFAQDAINEIYARNGYCFRDEGIRNYYEAQPWYYADESFTTSDFNDIEEYNIDLLMEYT